MTSGFVVVRGCDGHHIRGTPHYPTLATRLAVARNDHVISSSRAHPAEPSVPVPRGALQSILSLFRAGMPWPRRAHGQPVPHAAART